MIDVATLFVAFCSKLEVGRHLTTSFVVTHPRGGGVFVSKALHHRLEHSREVFVDAGAPAPPRKYVITAKDTRKCLGSAVIGNSRDVTQTRQLVQKASCWHQLHY